MGVTGTGEDRWRPVRDGAAGAPAAARKRAAGPDPYKKDEGSKVTAPLTGDQEGPTT